MAIFAERESVSTSGVTATESVEHTWPTSLPSARVLLVALLLLSLAFSVSVIFRAQNPYGTLEPKYTDHLRHERYAEELLHRGLGLYSEPAGQLTRFGWEDDRTYIWPEVSYPYPVGALLFHLPAGVAIYRLGVNPVLVNQLVIVAYVALAHIGVFLFAREWLLTGRGGNIFIGLWLVAAFWALVVVWSLNAQFEALPLLFPLLAARRYWQGRHLEAALWVGVALFFKYQAAIFAPLVLGMLWQARSQGWRTLWRPGLVALMGVVGLDLYTTVISYHFVQIPEANLVSLDALLAGRWVPTGFRLLATATLTVSLTGLLAWRRQWMLAASAAFAVLFLASLPQVQGWYVLWLFPLALFGRGTDRDSVGFWTLGLCYLIYQLPDPAYLAGAFAPFFH